MTKAYSELGGGLGWLPASIVIIIVRYSVFGPGYVSDTTLFWMAVLVGGPVWLLCWFVGHLLDEKEKTKAELQTLKDKVDRLER